MREVMLPQTLDDPPLVMIFDAAQFAMVVLGMMLGAIFGGLLLWVAGGWWLGGVLTRHAQVKPRGFLRHRLHFQGIPTMAPGYPHGLDRMLRP